MPVIINADDFGYNQSINSAIISCFKQGICSSTTIMANMPGFEEACELTHQHNLENHVGIHLVLTEGVPLTDKIKKQSLFCDNDGQFCLPSTKRVFSLTYDEKTALQEEIRAQIKRCSKWKLALTHLDSHFHAHVKWAVSSVIIPIVKAEGIPAIRLCRNSGKGITIPKQIYKFILNKKFQLPGLVKTDYFGGIEDYRFYIQHMGKGSNEKIWEIMIHPYFDKNNQLIDFMENQAFDSFADLFSKQELISYNGTKYSF